MMSVIDAVVVSSTGMQVSLGDASKMEKSSLLFYVAAKDADGTKRTNRPAMAGAGSRTTTEI